MGGTRGSSPHWQCFNQRQVVAWRHVPISNVIFVRNPRQRRLRTRTNSGRRDECSSPGVFLNHSRQSLKFIQRSSESWNRYTFPSSILNTEHKDLAIVRDFVALVTAVDSPGGEHSPVEQKLISYIKHFAPRMSHIPGDENILEDYLSRSSVEEDGKVTLCASNFNLPRTEHRIEEEILAKF